MWSCYHHSRFQISSDLAALRDLPLNTTGVCSNDAQSLSILLLFMTARIYSDNISGGFIHFALVACHSPLNGGYGFSHGDNLEKLTTCSEGEANCVCPSKPPLSSIHNQHRPGCNVDSRVFVARRRLFISQRRDFLIPTRGRLQYPADFWLCAESADVRINFLTRGGLLGGGGGELSIFCVLFCPNWAHCVSARLNQSHCHAEVLTTEKITPLRSHVSR